MSYFLRSSLRIVLILLVVFSLGACSPSMTAGLEPFQSPDGRYGFLYPTGWTRVAVSDGPAVVFHDLINSDETLSLVVSKLNVDVDLENLGSPSDVAQKLLGEVMSAEGEKREVELLETQSRESSEHVFYDLEYTLNVPGSKRHELATVVVDRGYLYTFAASTDDLRWSKVDSLFNKVIKSFTFLS